LAPPQITRQRSSATSSAPITPPSAHGASTSTAARSACGGSAELGRERALSEIDIGQHQLRPLGRQPVRQRPADVAYADDCHRAPGQAARAEHLAAAGAHRRLHAGRREAARVAAAAALAGLADDVL
jgi:hypothetical protein